MRRTGICDTKVCSSIDQLHRQQDIQARISICTYPSKDALDDEEIPFLLEREWKRKRSKQGFHREES